MPNIYSFDCNNHKGYCQIDTLFSTNQTITNQRVSVQSDKKTYLLNTLVRTDSLSITDLYNNVIPTTNYTVNYANGAITFIQNIANDILVTYDKVIAPTSFPNMIVVEFLFKWTGRYNTVPFGFAKYGLMFYKEYFGFTTGDDDIYGMSALGLERQWHHVYAIFNTDDITKNQIYLDGKLQILKQRTGTPNATNMKFSNLAMIGSWPKNAANNFDGLIDEFRVWTKVNNVRDINMNIYNVLDTSLNNYDGLIAYYRFDENNSKVKDYSSNKRCIYVVGGLFSKDTTPLNGYNQPQNVTILNPISEIPKNTRYALSYMVTPSDSEFKEVSMKLKNYSIEDDTTFFVHEIDKTEWEKIIDLEVK